MAEDDRFKGFLTRDEKKQLQSIYEQWLNEIKLEPLLTKLYNARLVTPYDQQRIAAERTDYNKAQLIFHDILMRSPYEDLSKVRGLLVETGAGGNIGLAKLFPRRGEDIDFTPPPSQPNPDEKIAQQCTDTKGHDDLDLFDLEDAEPMDTTAPEVIKNAGLFSTKKSSTKPPLDPIQRIDTYYERKPANRECPTGKGLCVVIRNFSDDLPGYSADAMRIRQFFAHLGYDILEGSKGELNLVNMNHAAFHLALTKIRAKLADENENYDRFFMFILSHGDDKGLIMSELGHGTNKEEGTRYPVDDIIAQFTHDSKDLPALKHFPKCFFIQACRGEEVAKSAAYSDPPAPKPPKPIPESQPQHHSFQVTVGADILICFPSQMGYLSWVPSSGSWFIQEMMGVFHKFYQSTHVLDMMTEVAKLVSKINRPGHHKSTPDGSVFVQESVCQMPHIVSTLTDRFFLSLPPK